MRFMDEDCSSSTGARIKILVVAPYSEIDIPIMEPQLYVASSVGTVPANAYAFRMSVLRDGGDIEILSCIELYARKQYECRLGRMLVYGLEDVFRRNGALVSIRLDDDHRFFRVQVVQYYQRLNGILARRVLSALKKFGP